MQLSAEISAKTRLHLGETTVVERFLLTNRRWNVAPTTGHSSRVRGPALFDVFTRKLKSKWNEWFLSGCRRCHTDSVVKSPVTCSSRAERNSTDKIDYARLPPVNGYKRNNEVTNYVWTFISTEL